jgi:hypothetical protein
MSAVYRQQLDDLLDRLPEENLRALLDVLKRLGGRRPIRRWSSAIGRLSEADAEQMKKAIEEGCEQIDPESW